MALVFGEFHIPASCDQLVIIRIIPKTIFVENGDDWKGGEKSGPRIALSCSQGKRQCLATMGDDHIDTLVHQPDTHNETVLAPALTMLRINHRLENLVVPHFL